MDEHDKGQVAASAAEIYDQFFVPALFAEWPERVLDAAGVTAGDSVLDVACGTGILARKTAEIVGPGETVIGLDVNQGMLSVAEKKGPDVEWRVGVAEELPFDNDTFDAVVSQFGLMFFEDKVKAIREMERVVRPSGTVAVAVWGPLEATPGYAMVAEILEELFGKEIANSIQAPYSLGDKETLLALFEKSGVEELEIHTIVGKVCFQSLDDWMYTDIKGWTLADVIDDAGYERLRQYAPEKLNQFVQPDGTVMFEAPAHIVVFNP